MGHFVSVHMFSPLLTMVYVVEKTKNKERYEIKKLELEAELKEKAPSKDRAKINKNKI